MNHLKLFLWLLSSLFSLNVAYSQIPQMELYQTQVLQLKSAINNQDYVLNVALPDSYGDTSKRYPVLYVLDAQWSFTFPVVRGIQAGLFYDGFIPEMIVVGITWPSDYDAQRGRDFTPTPIKEFPNSGGAPKFLNVIKKEIIPLINTTYRIEPNNNTLSGGSMGGYFELYALFQEPTLFNHYIVGSPPLEDGSELSKLADNFVLKNHALNVKVFMHTGETEPSIYFNQYIAQLKAKSFEGLELESLIVPKMGHVSEIAYGVSRGLQFVFNEPGVIVDTLLLDQYVGHYKLAEDSIAISRTGHLLYVKSKMGTIQLYAKTNDLFYAKGFPGSAEFKKDKEGKGFDYVITIGNDAMVFKKID